jgi:hypothetical protein
MEDSEDDEDVVTTYFMQFRGDAPERIESYVEKIVAGYCDSQFQENFRMSRYAFDKLQGLVSKIFLDADLSISLLQNDLLAVIWLLATPDSFRYYIAIIMMLL